MNNEEYLKKVISFEDGKLLCDGLEISIEEAEEIIKIQTKAMEEEVYTYIQENPDLNREEISSLSDTVIETQMRVAHSKIDIKDLDEYQDIRKDISKAEEICDRALKLFDFKSKKINKEVIKKKSIVKWKYQPDDVEEYEPSEDEVVETGFELLIRELVIMQFKKQFATADIEITYEDIQIDGNFEDEFLIYIVNKDIEIYFQINENKGFFQGLRGNFIGSGLRVNSMLLQTSLDNFSDKSSHTIKTAFTFDNIITMQIRLLKNTIKQEINYSLAKSIAKANDRFAISNFFMINFGVLLDKKTKKKLNNIINQSIELMESNKKNIESLEESTEEIEKIIVEKSVEEKIDPEIFIRKNISEVFSVKFEQIKIEFKENKKDKIYDIQTAGQKIIISLLDSGVVLLSSTNTLGTGKTDIQNMEITGNDLYEKISKAILTSYIPILNRQIENLFNNIKGKESKKIAKSLEKNLKEIVQDMPNNQIDNSQMKEKIDFIIDNSINIDSINYESVFEILDRVIEKYFLNNFKDTNIVVKDKKFEVSDIFDVFKATLYKYKLAEDSGDSLIERLENIKKYINRLLALTEVIKLIQEYKDLKFNSEYSKEQIEKSIDKENDLRHLADNLSEDNIIGGTARKLLSLMDVSISAKDEMFKFNLDEILYELSMTNL